MCKADVRPRTTPDEMTAACTCLAPDAFVVGTEQDAEGSTNMSRVYACREWHI